MPTRDIFLFEDKALPRLATADYDCSDGTFALSLVVGHTNKTVIKWGEDLDDFINLIQAAIDVVFSLVPDDTWTQQGIDRKKFKDSVTKLLEALKKVLNKEQKLVIEYGIKYLVSAPLCDKTDEDGARKYFSVDIVLIADMTLQANVKPVSISSRQTTHIRIGHALIPCVCPEPPKKVSYLFPGGEPFTTLVSIPESLLAAPGSTPQQETRKVRTKQSTKGRGKTVSE